MLSQQLLQVLQHDLRQWNRPPSKPPQHFFLQQPVLQQLLQAGASQQVGSAAQQAGSQAAASQQVGSQQLEAQQLDLQQLWQANRPLKPPNRPQCLWQPPQPELQQLSQPPQAGASQQVGSAAQQAGSAAQQVGSAAQQVGSQQLLQQVLHPPQPPER
ncbi:MAG TPA: hypothetical protein VHD36_08815 [Pirellulales bacterium]|nr:hypothetical protein [Pirellulales bacterium]